MKTNLITTFAAVVMATSLFAAEPPATPTTTNSFTVTGMHCDSCAKGITSELKRTPGVASATVTFSNQLAIVAFDTNRVSSVQLIKVIEEAGFKAKLQKP